MLLHEIAHHDLRHPSEAIGPTAHIEEHDADRFASDWLLHGVSDSAILLKRSIGIAVANLVLITLDLCRASFESTSHPASYERLQRNLRDRQLAHNQTVHAFLGAMLQATLSVFGVRVDVDLDATFCALVDDLSFQLHRYAQNRS